MDRIKALIRQELKLSNDGEQYICDANDGMRFISHLLYEMTDGKEGEKSVCIANRKTD